MHETRNKAMNVLEGDRFEQRRILLDGRPEWTGVEGDGLIASREPSVALHSLTGWPTTTIH